MCFWLSDSQSDACSVFICSLNTRRKHPVSDGLCGAGRWAAVISAYKWAITRVLRPASLCALLKAIYCLYNCWNVHHFALFVHSCMKSSNGTFNYLIAFSKCWLVTGYLALTSWCGTGAYEEYAVENTMQKHNMLTIRFVSAFICLLRCGSAAYMVLK